MIRLHNEPPPSNPVDERIDHVLQALGRVEPTPNLNTRLLANLANHAEVPATATRASWHFAPSGFFSFAGTALLILIALGLHHFLASRSQTSSNLAHSNLAPHHNAPVPALSDSRPPTQENLATSTSLLINHGGQSTAHPTSQIQNSPIITQQTPAPATASATQPNEIRFHLQLSSSPEPAPDNAPPTQAALDAQALDDLHAPSQLAPALTATSQERLVRLMLRRGEKHELAELAPAERAAFSERQHQEFTRFFGSPLPSPLQISPANRARIAQAVSLEQVRQIEAAQPSAPVPSSPPQPSVSGDLK